MVTPAHDCMPRSCEETKHGVYLWHVYIRDPTSPATLRCLTLLHTISGTVSGIYQRSCHQGPFGHILQSTLKIAQQNAMHSCTAGHKIFHLYHLSHMKSSASLGWGWHASAQLPRHGAVAGGPAQRMRGWPSRPLGHPQASSLRLLLQQPCLQISFPTCCPGRHPAWTPKLPATSISCSNQPQHPSMP